MDVFKQGEIPMSPSIYWKQNTTLQCISPLESEAAVTITEVKKYM